MDNPELELRQIVLDLTENDDPSLQKATIDKFFTQDASLIHPFCTILSGPDSRDSVKDIYAVYKVLTRDIEINIKKITVDAACTRAVIDLEEALSLRRVPFLRVRNIKIISILDLERIDNKFYVKRQYDAFPLDHADAVLPFGFLYTWWKLGSGVVGDAAGLFYQKTGIW